jgi:hypothetical protein
MGKYPLLCATHGKSSVLNLMIQLLLPKAK